MDELLTDLLQDLRDAGLELLPWRQIASSVKDSVMAIAYAPVPGGIPAQVFLRPLTNELAIVVARENADAAVHHRDRCWTLTGMRNTHLLVD